MASALMSVLAAVEKLVEGQQRLAENQAAGFKEVNERLDRLERTLQVGKTAESGVSGLKTELKMVNDRLDAQRNLIAKANESSELLKIRVQK